jgi:hypothetical protein
MAVVAKKGKVGAGNNATAGRTDTDIYIYSHIPFRPVVSNPTYKILTCSHEAFPPTKLKIYRDYEYNGSLSDNNLVWNEYSGIHCIAYNDKMPMKEFVGFTHYRRQFYFLDNIFDMQTMFDNYDIVLGDPVYFHKVMRCDPNEYTVENQYGYYHNIRDLWLLRDIIKDMHPEMADTVDDVFENKNYLFNSFMSIWRMEDFLDYADFCFPVLFEFCKQRNCYTSDDWIKYCKDHAEEYQKPYLPYYSNLDGGGGNSRVVGFLAERLCNIYLHHKRSNGSSLVDKAAVIPWHMVPEEKYKV